MYLPNSNGEIVWAKVRSCGEHNFNLSVDHPRILDLVITHDMTYKQVVSDLNMYHKAGFRVSVTTFGTRFRWEPRDFISIKSLTRELF
jgi:hypothetical protein